jgi:hypothetical protein
MWEITFSSLFGKGIQEETMATKTIVELSLIQKPKKTKLHKTPTLTSELLQQIDNAEDGV